MEADIYLIISRQNKGHLFASNTVNAKDIMTKVVEIVLCLRELFEKLKAPHDAENVTPHMREWFHRI